MESLSDVIARKTLYASQHEVRIEIAAPALEPELEGSYQCRYTISGLPGRLEIAGQAEGHDSVQALLLALTMIGDRLNASQLSFNSTDGHGFPSTDSITDTKWTTSTRHRIRQL